MNPLQRLFGLASKPRARRAASGRFLLSVDHGGQHMVAVGERLTLGHLRAGHADLPFLADVGGMHAELVRSNSLHEGPVWSVRALGSEKVALAGAAVAQAGARLAAGDVCRLGENLAFRFLVPDPASHTVVLELLDSAECAGAMRICLLGEGEGGRLRIGSADQRHIRVAGLDEELELLFERDRLRLRSTAGIAGAGGRFQKELEIAFPLKARIDLSLATGPRGRPPFGVAFAPVELAGFGAQGSVLG